MQSNENIEIIPTILHPIWLGGFPGKDILNNIVKWRKTNPDYEVNLWIDSSTYSDNDKENLLALLNWAKNHNIVICDINPKPRWDMSEMIAYRNESGIYYGMKEKNINLQQYFDDELNGEFINYGAASDILRVEILYRKGGVYFDSGDIFPGEKMELPIKTKYGFLFNDTTRSNDIMASVPHGKIITNFRNTINENYKNLYMNEADLNAHRNDALRHPDIQARRTTSSKADTTIELSGPRALLNSVKEYEVNHAHKDISFPKHYFTEDMQTGSWYKKRLDDDVELVSSILRNYIRHYFNKIINEEINKTSTEQIKHNIEFMKALPNKPIERESAFISLLKFKKTLNAIGTKALDLNQIYDLCNKIDVNPELKLKLKNLSSATEILIQCMGSGYKLNDDCGIKIKSQNIFNALNEFSRYPDTLNDFMNKVMTNGNNPKPAFDQLNDFQIIPKIYGKISPDIKEPWIQKKLRLESYEKSTCFSTLQGPDKLQFINDLLDVRILDPILEKQYQLDHDNLDQIKDALLTFDGKDILKFEEKRNRMLDAVDDYLKFFNQAKLRK